MRRAETHKMLSRKSDRFWEEYDDVRTKLQSAGRGSVNASTRVGVKTTSAESGKPNARKQQQPARELKYKYF